MFVLPNVKSLQGVLTCCISKVPYPNITWRREDGRPIYRDVQRSNGVRLDSNMYQGEYLDLQVRWQYAFKSMKTQRFKFIHFRIFPGSRWERTCA